jgi:hypothetical protein
LYRGGLVPATNVPLQNSTLSTTDDPAPPRGWILISATSSIAVE